MQELELNSAPSQFTPRTGAPPAWRVSVWKDAVQIRQAFLAIVAGLTLVELIFAAASIAMSQSSQFGQITEPLFAIAFSGPVMMVIACSGMLIGHERQTGTWDWNSSLPIPWLHTLASKIAVTLLSALGVLIPLLVVPILSAVYYGGVTTEGWLWNTYASSITLIFLFSVIAVFYTATLLFRDTLHALMVGCIAIVLSYIAVVLAVGLFVPRGSSLAYYGNSQQYLYATTIVTGVLGLIAVAICAATYRWRWGAGQQAQLIGASTSLTSRVSNVAVIRHLPSLSQRRMLLAQNLRVAFGFRFALLGCIGILAFFLINGSGEGVVPFAMIVTTLLGVSVFEGDQTLNRFRFLADRGVSPSKLLITRALLPGSFVLLIAITTSFIDFRYTPLVWLVYLGAFLTGILASLSFQKNVVSGTVAVITSILAIVLYLVLLENSRFYWGDPNPRWLAQYSIAVYTLVSLPILVVAIFRFTRAWIVLETPKLAKMFLSTIAATTILPVILVATFSFLALPNVTYQGYDEIPSSARQGRIDAPLFFASSPDRRSLFEDSALEDFEITIVNTVHNQTLVRQWGEILGELNRTANADASVLGLINDRLSSLVESLELPTQQVDSILFVNALNRLIPETAVYAAFAMERDDTELAMNALRANHALQEIAVQQFAVETVNARALASQLLSERLNATRWTEAQIKELSGLLLPDLGTSEQQLEEWVKVQATVSMRNLRGMRTAAPKSGMYTPEFPFLVRLYPPVRWRQERAIAYNLNATLRSIRTPNMGSNFGYNMYSWQVTNHKALAYSTRNVIQTRLSQLVPIESDSPSDETSVEQETPGLSGDESPRP